MKSLAYVVALRGRCASVDGVRLQEFLDDSEYFRFQPIHQAFACLLDETDPKKIEAMAVASMDWCERNHERIVQLANVIAPGCCSASG